MSDEDLFRAYKNGNVDAFKEIMNKYEGPNQKHSRSEL